MTTTATAPRIEGHEMTLPDGRTLAWEEFGDRSGQAVFLLHGTPGSRLWFDDDDPVAHRLGLRLIAADRPGCGRSTPQPDRTLRGWADDVSHLVSHLGVERLAVLGASGGGAFAAAVAHELPGRVAAAALVASPCPLDAPGIMSGMTLANRVAFGLMRHLPRAGHKLLDWNYAAFARLLRDEPGRYVEEIVSRLCEADRAILREPRVRRAFIREQQEGLRHGHTGALRDGVLISRDWGFDLARINVPVDVWHGEQDHLAPIAMGRYLAARIPGARGHFYSEAGHLLTEDPARWQAMLEPLAAALAARPAGEAGRRWPQPHGASAT